VLAQDDLGLSELRLEWRKDAADAWHEQSLARFADEPREARANARWDASPLSLLPGESGVFRFVALDNARPGARGRATSAEFRVRFPSLRDLYTSLDKRQDKVAETLEHAQEQTRELQKSLDKLQRTPPSQNAQTPSFERAAEVKRTAERQQAVAEQVRDAAREMRETLDQATERQAFQEQLQRKLKEMSELLKDVQSPQFKDALKRMQDALEKMDRRAMEESLPKLQQENKDMLQQLQRSLELLKQLREEERLEALANRADELRQQQDELNREHGDPSKQDRSDDHSKDPSNSSPEGRPSLTQRQKDAADQTRELARDTRQAAQQSEDPTAQQHLQQAAQELEQNATQQQADAGKRSSEGDSQGAQSSGQKASQSLSRASSAMRQGSQAQQQEQDARSLAAVRRASQDLVSLSRESQSNLDPRKSTQQAAESQTDSLGWRRTCRRLADDAVAADAVPVEQGDAGARTGDGPGCRVRGARCRRASAIAAPAAGVALRPRSTMRSRACVRPNSPCASNRVRARAARRARSASARSANVRASSIVAHARSRAG
jgi:hypothetical protein